MNKLAPVLALLSLTPCFAQTMPSPEARPEQFDLGMYTRIRAEGFEHSRVMDYATALFDDIGPRLTGSPNLAKANAWTRDQLAAMGCANAHLESWGDFGMGWRQIGATAFMEMPDTAVFIAQATPWSPATAGDVRTQVIAVPWLKDEKEFDAWKDKLRGKVILYGAAPAILPSPTPLMQSFDAKKLDEIFSYPPNLDFTEQRVLNLSPKEWADVFGRVNFQEKVTRFFAGQGAVAVLVSSYSGDGGILRDDNNEALGHYVYRPDHKQPIPSAVLANEAFGRISRLLMHDVPVTLDLNIHTEFTRDHEQGYNTIAEIPGTDPKLKDQVVMIGGHLDSWIAGTGATDNGAGVIVAMEVMRILTALHVHPRRTIRIALWSGEEQGDMGSLGYVHRSLATMGYATTPEQLAVPEFLREQVGPITPKPDYDKFSVYFNIDNGGGKLLGVYAGGNEEAASIFAQWIKPLKDLGVTTITLRPSRSSDQDSFNDVGLPAFQFIQDPRDYRTRSVHSNQDTYERLSPDDLKQAAIVEAIFAYNAAMRNQPIPRMPPPTFSRTPEDATKNLMPDASSVK